VYSKKTALGLVDRAPRGSLVLSAFEGGFVKSRREVSKAHRAPATIVDLSSVRAQKKRELAERRVRGAMTDNRAALTRLFTSGLIFTQKGSRAGRDLLLAHQSLLKVVDVFARLVEQSSREDLALKVRAEEVFRQLDAQLARAAQLTQRTGEFLSGRSRD
jgi:hypothetical protein